MLWEGSAKLWAYVAVHFITVRESELVGSMVV